MKEIACSVCGEPMLYDSDSEPIGISISLLKCGDLPKEFKEKMIGTFGKTKFDICWFCFLKSLGIKTI